MDTFYKHTSNTQTIFILVVFMVIAFCLSYGTSFEKYTTFVLGTTVIIRKPSTLKTIHSPPQLPFETSTGYISTKSESKVCMNKTLVYVYLNLSL